MYAILEYKTYYSFMLPNEQKIRRESCKAFNVYFSWIDAWFTLLYEQLTVHQNKFIDF